MTAMPGTIRYCTTRDGVRLAFRSIGQGSPVIKAANWLGNLQSDAEIEATRHWVDAISRRHTLIWYDGRGCGLSDRDVGSISLDAWVLDLQAVIEAAGHERFVLLGISQGAAIAIRYAARHAQRVRGLIVYGGYVRGVHHQGISQRTRFLFDETVRIAELGWGSNARAFRNLFLARMLPGASESILSEYDARYRNTVSGVMAARYMQAFYEIDAREDAARVACPSLVLHVEGDLTILKREGELVASLIPGARWVLVPGENHLPLATDPGWPVIRREIDAFLENLAAGEDAAAPPRLTSRQREVLVLVARGLTDKGIARQLALSPRTVEMHVAGAIDALGCRSRSEAVSRAHFWKLLP